MADPSIKESVMSSNMRDSVQRLNTKSKQRKGGALLGNVPPNKSPSLRPDLMGRQFLNVKIFSPEIAWRGPAWKKKRYAQCVCVACGDESVIALDWLCGKEWRGCAKCRKAAQVPPWLVARVKSMKSRCTKVGHKAYPDYGGRGIKFRFSSVRAGAEWIKANLVIPKQSRDTQLDRINNDGHYEPGNLRWTSKRLNVCNTRRGGWVAKMHKFRLDHQAIRYADKTLRNMFSMGLTEEQIIARYHQKSDKPKGVYGTYATPDPEIASLVKDF